MAPEVLLVLALASTVCFVVVGGFVGIKLLMLARRTRQLPELTVGLGFVLVAFLGYPLGLAALGLEGAVARAAFCVGTVAASLGSMSIYVFTWRVFRPEESWARVLAGAGMLGLAAVAVASVAEAMHGDQVTDPYLVHRQLLVGVSYAWTAAESLRYWGLLRRRLVLGLADPLVANRFLLWALSGLFASGGIAVSTAVAFAGHHPAGHPVSMLAIGVAGFATSVTIYLAFVPPEAYRRRVAAAAPGVRA